MILRCLLHRIWLGSWKNLHGHGRTAVLWQRSDQKQTPIPALVPIDLNKHSCEIGVVYLYLGRADSLRQNQIERVDKQISPTASLLKRRYIDRRREKQKIAQALPNDVPSDSWIQRSLPQVSFDRWNRSQSAFGCGCQTHLRCDSSNGFDPKSAARIPWFL